MNLQDIARALGGEVTGGQVLAPGPNHSAADRSLAIRPSHQSPFGFIAHSHAGDDWRVCRDFVAAKLGLNAEISAISKNAPRGIPITSQRRKTDGQISPSAGSALTLWHEGSDPGRTIVETYLASRALDLPEGIGDDVLRFHPQCPWRDESDSPMRVPAMLALFRSIEGNAPAAIHRTALTPDGEKIGRKMLGPVKGAAIKLDPDEAVTISLAIGEGTETCLAARQLGIWNEQTTWTKRRPTMLSRRG